jgi:dGTPase
MYRHSRVLDIMEGAQRVLRKLFEHYMAQPNHLPVEWSRGIDTLDETDRARRMADFIAGMTDRFALAEHARFFDSTPELR